MGMGVGLSDASPLRRETSDFSELGISRDGISRDGISREVSSGVSETSGTPIAQPRTMVWDICLFCV